MPVTAELAGMALAVAVPLLAGLAAMSTYVKYYIDGDWGWLDSWGKRLRFLFWPLPPRYIVKIIDLNGRVSFLYDPEIQEVRGGLVFHSHGALVEVRPTRTAVTGLNEYVKGANSPAHYLAAAMAGHLTMYFAAIWALGEVGLNQYLAFAVLAWAYLWYNAATTPMSIYIPVMVVEAGPGVMHGIPAPGEAISPREFFRLMNRPVVVRVDRNAEAALHEVKKLLGVEDVAVAAEVLAAASTAVLAKRFAVAMAARAAQLGAGMRQLQVYIGDEIRRVTLAKVLVWLVILGLGVLIGAALFGGTDIVVTPAQPPAGPG